MSKQFDKLVVILKELFQLDQPDLDFGLYRIMHAKPTRSPNSWSRTFSHRCRKRSATTTADKAVLEDQSPAP